MTRPARLTWTEVDHVDDGTRAALFGPGGHFELITAEVLGCEVAVFAKRPRSLAELLANAGGHGDRPFLVDGDRSVTFAGLGAELAGRASLLGAAGVGQGDRVLLAGRTSLDLCATTLAVLSMGAVGVVANPAWTDAEFADAVELATPTLIVADGMLGTRLASLAPVRVIGWTALDPGGPPAGPPPSSDHPTGTAAAVIGEDDPAAIVFTSGTTGRAKGAVLTHRNAVHFCLSNAATALARRLRYPAAKRPGPATSPSVIASAPMFHVSGLLGQLVNAGAWGLTLVIAPPGRWDPVVHLELSARHGITTWSLVPTQLWRLLEHPRLGEFDLSALEAIGGGGATFEPALLALLGERLPHVSAGMRVGYGMTEASGTLTLLQPPIQDHERASVGRAIAGAEVTVRGPDGQVLSEGEIGEVWGRGAGIFFGYWADPVATEAALDADRWYATGDFGRIQDGLLFIESRLRDMILRGGENIYPIEIEHRLVEHPDIVEAAVVGVEHATLGQEVKAVVVCRRSLDADDVRAWVAQTLARHKVPAHVAFLDALPRNDTGKVRKDAL